VFERFEGRVGGRRRGGGKGDVGDFKDAKGGMFEHE
jgi:hypothetical protein